jgi:proline dehydrogenase
MIDAISKAFFHGLARSLTLKRLASRYGMRKPGSFARRFIAGETVEEAIHAARAVEAAGLEHTLDQLGESVATMSEADAATREYLAIVDKIVAAGIGRNISLKLTQLGLSIDRATCVDNLRRILDAASPHDFFVRVDMEDSPITQVTLDIFETMWQQGYRNVGTVLQSYLPRSVADARRLNELGARVRLVKGAYNEPKGVAYQQKSQVDAAFIEIMELLLSEGTFPRHRDTRRGDDRRDEGVRGPPRDRQGPLRVPVAVWHPAGPAGAAPPRGLRGPRIRPLRA